MSPHLKLPTTRSAILYCTSALILAAITACARVTPEQSLDDYLQRLTRTLRLEAPKVIVQTLPATPTVNELRHELPSANLGALDFLSLSGCAVQITIGKRNSSLGIMASDSQRLLLELEYLKYAPQCIAKLRKAQRGDLADVLEEASALKRQQLPRLIFNATLANTEFRQFWKKRDGLESYPEQTNSAVLSALAAINQLTRQWLAGNYSADNLEFEILLSEIARGDGGMLLYALSLQASYLNAADALLRKKLTPGPLCYERHRDAAADILPNVLRKFFIAKIQPRSAKLGRRHYELLTGVSQLEELLSAGLSEEYEQWRQRRNLAFASAVEAPREHVSLLKETLDSCGGLGTLT